MAKARLTSWTADQPEKRNKEPMMMPLLRLLILLLPCSTSEAMLDFHKGDMAYPVQVYHLRDFRQWSPRNLFDVLVRLPGVSLQQNHGNVQLQLHGMNNQYLSLLVNGVPLAGAGIGHRRVAQQIPASLIHRIEIIRSGRADLDSQGGGSGTINVILNNHDNRKGQWAASMSGKPFSSHANVTLPFATASQMTVDHQQLQQRFDISQPGNTYSQFIKTRAQALHLNYSKPGDRQQRPLGLNLLYLSQRQRQHTSPTSIRHAHHKDYTLRLSSRTGFNWRTLNFDTQALLEQFHQQKRGSITDLTIDDQRWQLRTSMEETLNEHHWQTGLIYRRFKTRVRSPYSSRFLIPVIAFNATNNSLHWFALDRWQLSSSTLFEAGFRMETYSLRQQDIFATQQEEKTGDTYWLPSVHLLHKYNQYTRLRVSASQSARQPDLDLRTPYLVRKNTIELRGNGQLDAEVVSSLDINYEHSFNHDSLAQDNGFIIHAFQRSVNKAILSSSREIIDNKQPITVIQPENSNANVKQKGIEWQLNRRVSERWRSQLYAGLFRSYVRATDQSAARRLPSQPNYSFQWQLAYQIHKWGYGAQWRYQGKTEQYLNNFTHQGEQQLNRAKQHLDMYLRFQTSSWHYTLTLVNLIKSRWMSIIKDQQRTLYTPTTFSFSISGSF